MVDGTVVVAGGGLAGLVAARHLADAGADVRLYEREQRVGGRVRSTHEDGYVFDRGFQVLFTAYPAVQRELDLEALDLRRFAPGAVIARPGERSVLADPLRDPSALLESALTREVTLGDKLRTLGLRHELSRTATSEIFGGPDESIRALLRERGFSPSFVEHFAAPFYGGITLDRSLSTSSRIFEYTFKTLSSGAIAVPAGGMGAIATQLADAARRAGAEITTDAPVTAVETDADGVAVTADGERLEPDAAVVATDPSSARDLTGVEAIPTDAKGCVTQWYRLPASVATDGGRPDGDAGDPSGSDDPGDRVPVDVADETDGDGDGTGDGDRDRDATGVEDDLSDDPMAKLAAELGKTLVEELAESVFGPDDGDRAGGLGVGRRLVLNAVDGRPNHVVDHTAVAPEYAPAGETVLSATFLEEPDAGDRVVAAEDDELAAETRETLGAWFSDRSFEGLELLHTDRIPFAQLAQPPGFREEWPSVTAPPGPMYLAGDYTAWSSINGAMQSGYAAARVAADRLE